MKTFASALQPPSPEDAAPQSAPQPAATLPLVSPTRYVAPKSGNTVPSLLTPESLRQANSLGDPSQRFSAEKAKLVSNMETLQNLQAVPKRRSHAVRQLDFNQFKIDTALAANHGDLHSLAAGSPELYRQLSASLLTNAQAVTIEKCPASDLNASGRAADAQAFSTAIADMGGPAGLTPNACWPYLQGAVQNDGRASSRNHLLTVASFKGLGQLRIYSVSGGYGNGTQSSVLKTRIHVKGSRPNGQILMCTSLPKKGNSKQCAAETSAPHMQAAFLGKRGVLYVGYDNMLIDRGLAKHEARVLPRTFSKRESGETQDRARDTEYVVLSALRIWLKANPTWQEAPLDLLMFSRLPMCPSCENAASHALLRPEFQNVGAFRVYSPPNGSR